MNTGTKIALGAILIIGLGVGGFLLYEKLQPKLGSAKPDGDKGGSGGTGGGASKPSDKPTDMTQGGEVSGKETKPADKPAPMGGSPANLGIFPNTVLKNGSGMGNLIAHQPYVKKLQKLLNSEGAKLIEDGKFGAGTEKALVSNTGKKTITISELNIGLKNANLSDNGKAFERGSNFAGIKIR